MATFKNRLTQLQAEIDAALAELLSDEHQTQLDADLAQAKADLAKVMAEMADPERQKATLTRLQAKVVKALADLQAEAGGDGE